MNKKKKPSLPIGTWVEVKDSAMMEAMGTAGKFGVVVGPDPEGRSPDVVQVDLMDDSAPKILFAKGCHVNNLRIVRIAKEN